MLAEENPLVLEIRTPPTRLPGDKHFLGCHSGCPRSSGSVALVPYAALGTAAEESPSVNESLFVRDCSLFTTT